MPCHPPKKSEGPQPVVKIAGGFTDKVRILAELTPGILAEELAAEPLGKPVIQAHGWAIFIVVFNLIVIVSQQAV